LLYCLIVGLLKKQFNNVTIEPSNMQTLRQVFTQTSWQLIGKAITSLSTLILLGLISRNFGEDLTGVITLSLTYIGFFIIACDFGLNAHIMDKLSSADSSAVWRKLFGLRIILGLIFLSLGYLILLFWPKADLVFLQLSFLGLTFALIQSVIFITTNAIFQLKGRYDLSIISTSLGTIVTLIAAYFLIAGRFPFVYIIGAYILGWILASIIPLFFVKKFLSTLYPIFDFKFIKETLKTSWPISATLFLNVVYFRIDSFLISYFRNFTEVGIYNLAYQIFQAALVLPTFIMNGFFPHMIEQFRENLEKFKLNVIKAASFLFALGFIGSITTYLLAPIIISLIAGENSFVESIEALRLLSWSFPFFFASSVFMWAFVVLKKYQVMLLIYIAGFITNLTLNFIFIPEFSYIAAAIVTLISELLILVLQVIILYFILFN